MSKNLGRRLIFVHQELIG